MVNNCLVTKLKGTVQNDNLPKFGVIRIPLMANLTSQNWKSVGTVVGTTEAPVFSLVSGDITVTDSSGTVALPFNFPLGSAYNIKVSTGNVAPVIEISNKYAISYLGNILNKASEEFSVSELVYLPLQALECSNVMVADVDDIVKIQTLVELVLSGENCRGDFANLGNLINLTTLNCYNARSNISGTIEEFVQRARLAGRTTGSVSFNPQKYASTITYQGSALDYQYTWTIAWTADSISVTH